MILFGLILFGTLCFLDLDAYFLSKVRKTVSYYVFRKATCPFRSLLLGTLIMWMSICLMLSWKSLILFSFLVIKKICFSFGLNDFPNSVFQLTVSLYHHFCIISVSLLNPSSVFFISVMIFFISVWFLFIFSLCLKLVISHCVHPIFSWVLWASLQISTLNTFLGRLPIPLHLVILLVFYLVPLFWTYSIASFCLVFPFYFYVSWPWVSGSL